MFVLHDVEGLPHESTLMTEDFESTPSQWDSFNYGSGFGYTNFRAQAGTGSLYCAAAGDSPVPAPGPMPEMLYSEYTRLSPVSLANCTTGNLEYDVWSSMTMTNIRPSRSNWPTKVARLDSRLKVKARTRVKPEFGSVWYHLMGADREHARTHFTIAVPGASSKTLGLPENGQQGGVWIMNAGTSTAHLMVPGE